MSLTTTAGNQVWNSFSDDLDVDSVAVCDRRESSGCANCTKPLVGWIVESEVTSASKEQAGLLILFAQAKTMA